MAAEHHYHLTLPTKGLLSLWEAEQWGQQKVRHLVADGGGTHALPFSCTLGVQGLAIP